MLSLAAGRVVAQRYCNACVEERTRRRADEDDGPRRLAQAGVVGWMATLSLETFDRSALRPQQGAHPLDAVLDLVQRLGELPAPNLVLWGARGRGKTRLAVGATMEAVRRGYTARYVAEYNLLDALRDPYATGASKLAARQAFTSPQLLVVDEVGSAQVRQYTAEEYLALIDERYLLGRATFLATNQPPAVLVQHLGEMAYGRLVERGLVVECAGPDRRVDLARAYRDSKGRRTAIRLAVEVDEPSDVPF